MSGRFAVGWVLVLALAATGGAAPLDPESKTPYTWRVLVQAKPDAMFGKAARAQLLKDLKDTLVPAIGEDLGSVEVIDLDAVAKEKWEPLWTRFDKVGWDALGEDEFRKLTGVKTHFLKVQVKNGKFHLESRQHDGSVGRASPQVRTHTGVDPQNLSRIAGLMVFADFGVVGTVESLPGTKDCLMRIRGGELAGMEKLVKAGDVFAFSVVSEIPRPLPKDAKLTALKPGQKADQLMDQVAKPQEYTLLRVLDLPKTGIAKCEVLTRFEKPLIEGRGVIGYRAIKLATRNDKMSLVLTDKDGKAPPPTTPIEVWATDNGFRTKPTTSDTFALEKNRFASGRSFSGVACVNVKLGTRMEPFVLPVLDTGAPLVLRFNFDENEVKKANYENACERFVSRVQDLAIGQDELVKALAGLIEKAQNKVALERAANGLKLATDADTELSKQLTDLRQDPLATSERAKRLLASGDKMLENARLLKPELEAKIEDLKGALAKAENPAQYEKQFKTNELTRQIAYHERRGEVQEALDVYDQLYELTKNDEVRARKKKLEDEWKPKTAEQAAARKFIAEEWIKVDSLAEVKNGVAKLKAAVDELIRNGDRLGLRHALTGIAIGYARLDDALKSLDPELVQDKQQVQVVKTTADELRKVEETAQAEVKKLEKK